MEQLRSERIELRLAREYLRKGGRARMAKSRGGFQFARQAVLLSLRPAWHAAAAVQVSLPFLLRTVDSGLRGTTPDLLIGDMRYIQSTSKDSRMGPEYYVIAFRQEEVGFGIQAALGQLCNFRVHFH